MRPTGSDASSGVQRPLKHIVDAFCIVEASSLRCEVPPVLDVWPITELCVVQPQRDTDDGNCTIITSTVSGHDADCNMGVMRQQVYIGYKRDRSLQPIVDISVVQGRALDSKRYRGYVIVDRTVCKHDANLNAGASGSTPLYLIYKRGTLQPSSADIPSLDTELSPISDVCIVNSSRGDVAPPNYEKLPWSLNKGSLGDAVYLCFRRAVKLNCPGKMMYQPRLVDKWVPEAAQNAKKYVPGSLCSFVFPVGTTVRVVGREKLCVQPHDSIDSRRSSALYDRVPSVADALDLQQHPVHRPKKRTHLRKRSTSVPPVTRRSLLVSSNDGAAAVGGLTVEIRTSLRLPRPKFNSFVLTDADNCRTYGFSLTFYDRLSPAVSSHIWHQWRPIVGLLRCSICRSVFQQPSTSVPICLCPRCQCPVSVIKDSVAAKNSPSSRERKKWAGLRRNGASKPVARELAPSMRLASKAPAAAMIPPPLWTGVCINDDAPQADSRTAARRRSRGQTEPIDPRGLPPYGEVGEHVPVLYAQKAIVILSKCPFTSFFRCMLQQLYEYAGYSPIDQSVRMLSDSIGAVPTVVGGHHPSGSTSRLPLEQCIAFLLSGRIPVPRPSYTLRLRLFPGFPAIAHSRTDARSIPDVSALYAPLLHCLSPANIVAAVKLLLLERSVVVHCRLSALLAPICEALLSLLFPLTWQAPYIPLCPGMLLDVLECPTAFFVGLETGLLPLVVPDHVYLVDLDRDRVVRSLGGDPVVFADDRITRSVSQLIDPRRRLRRTPSHVRSSSVRSSSSAGEHLPLDVPPHLRTLLEARIAQVAQAAGIHPGAGPPSNLHHMLPLPDAPPGEDANTYAAGKNAKNGDRSRTRGWHLTMDHRAIAVSYQLIRNRERVEAIVSHGLQDIFLRFMCILLAGYRSHVVWRLPMQAPSTTLLAGASKAGEPLTDPTSLLKTKMSRLVEHRVRRDSYPEQEDAYAAAVLLTRARGLEVGTLEALTPRPIRQHGKTELDSSVSNNTHVSGGADAVSTRRDIQLGIADCDIAGRLSTIPFVFDTADFLACSDAHLRPLLEEMVELQIFTSFLQMRAKAPTFMAPPPLPMSSPAADFSRRRRGSSNTTADGDHTPIVGPGDSKTAASVKEPFDARLEFFDACCDALRRWPGSDRLGPGHVSMIEIGQYGPSVVAAAYQHCVCGALRRMSSEATHGRRSSAPSGQLVIVGEERRPVECLRIRAELSSRLPEDVPTPSEWRSSHGGLGKTVDGAFERAMSPTGNQVGPWHPSIPRSASSETAGAPSIPRYKCGSCGLQWARRAPLHAAFCLPLSSGRIIDVGLPKSLSAAGEDVFYGYWPRLDHERANPSHCSTQPLSIRVPDAHSQAGRAPDLTLEPGTTPLSPLHTSAEVVLGADALPLARRMSSSPILKKKQSINRRADFMAPLPMRSRSSSAHGGSTTVQSDADEDDDDRHGLVCPGPNSPRRGSVITVLPAAGAALQRAYHSDSSELDEGASSFFSTAAVVEQAERMLTEVVRIGASGVHGRNFVISPKRDDSEQLRESIWPAPRGPMKHFALLHALHLFATWALIKCAPSAAAGISTELVAIVLHSWSIASEMRDACGEIPFSLEPVIRSFLRHLHDVIIRSESVSTRNQALRTVLWSFQLASPTAGRQHAHTGCNMSACTQAAFGAALTAGIRALNGIPSLPVAPSPVADVSYPSTKALLLSLWYECVCGVCGDESFHYGARGALLEEQLAAGYQYHVSGAGSSVVCVTCLHAVWPILRYHCYVAEQADGCDVCLSIKQGHVPYYLPHRLRYMAELTASPHDKLLDTLHSQSPVAFNMIWWCNRLRMPLPYSDVSVTTADKLASKLSSPQRTTQLVIFAAPTSPAAIAKADSLVHRCWPGYAVSPASVVSPVASAVAVLASPASSVGFGMHAKCSPIHDNSKAITPGRFTGAHLTVTPRRRPSRRRDPFELIHVSIRDHTVKLSICAAATVLVPYVARKDIDGAVRIFMAIRRQLKGRRARPEQPTAKLWQLSFYTVMLTIAQLHAPALAASAPGRPSASIIVTPETEGYCGTQGDATVPPALYNLDLDRVLEAAPSEAYHSTSITTMTFTSFVQPQRESTWSFQPRPSFPRIYQPRPLPIVEPGPYQRSWKRFLCQCLPTQYADDVQEPLSPVERVSGLSASTSNMMRRTSASIQGGIRTVFALDSWGNVSGVQASTRTGTIANQGRNSQARHESSVPWSLNRAIADALVTLCHEDAQRSMSPVVMPHDWPPALVSLAFVEVMGQLTW